MRRLGAAVILLTRFALAVVMSGAQTLGVIVRSASARHVPPHTAILRIPFAPMSANGAALLGAMVTLTPGTTTLDIDMARHQLLVHVLDAIDPQTVLAAIRRDFEPSLVILFGSRADA